MTVTIACGEQPHEIRVSLRLPKLGFVDAHGKPRIRKIDGINVNNIFDMFILSIEIYFLTKRKLYIITVDNPHYPTNVFFSFLNGFESLSLESWYLAHFIYRGKIHRNCLNRWFCLCYVSFIWLVRVYLLIIYFLSVIFLGYRVRIRGEENFI